MQIAQPYHQADPRYRDPAFRMLFARLVTHYWRHAAWLEDGILLQKPESLPAFLASSYTGA